MDATQTIMERIELLGSRYEESLKALKAENEQLKEERVTELKSKNSKLEDKIDSILAKGATSAMFGGTAKDPSLKADVLRAVQENQENIEKFRKGESHRLQLEVKAMDLANYTGNTVALNTAPLGIVGA